MTVKSEEDVVKLQISINDAIFMEVFESQANLSSVKSGKVLAKFTATSGEGFLLSTLRSELSTLDMKHQVTTANVLHHEIDSRLCLETGVEVGQERMSFAIGNQEDPLLGPNAFHFVVFNNEFLLEHLDGVEFP